MSQLKEKNFYIKEILFLALGSILGVVFSQFSFFELDEKISLGDLFIFVGTSIIGIYIASNITKSLSRVQTIKTLYQDDIKAIISSLVRIEGWLEGNSTLTLNELNSHFKTGNIKLRSIETTYKKTGQINVDSLGDIIIKYNNLKVDATNVSSNQAGNAIPLLPQQRNKILQDLEDLRSDLLGAIINA